MGSCNGGDPCLYPTDWMWWYEFLHHFLRR